MKIILSIVLASAVILGACSSSSNAPGNTEPDAVFGYITDGTSMKIVDIADPSAPVLKGSTPMFSSYKASVAEGVVYVAEWGTTGYYVNVVDVSDADNPNNVLQVPKDSTFGRAADLYVDGATIYIADEYRGLHIMDVTGGTFTPHANYANTGNAQDAPGVTKLGDYLYLIHQNANGTGQFGLEKFDLSTTGQVNSTSVFNTADVDSSTFNDSSGVFYSMVEHDGTHVYVANLGDKMFRKFDPTNLAKLSEVDMGGHPTALAIADGFAYVTVHPSANPPFNTGDDAIKMINLATMAVVDSQTLSLASGVAVYDGKAYVTDATGMHVYDISGGSLSLITSLTTGNGNYITLGKEVNGSIFSTLGL